MGVHLFFGSKSLYQTTNYLHKKCIECKHISCTLKLSNHRRSMSLVVYSKLVLINPLKTLLSPIILSVDFFILINKLLNKFNYYIIKRVIIRNACYSLSSSPAQLHNIIFCLELIVGCYACTWTWVIHFFSLSSPSFSSKTHTKQGATSKAKDPTLHHDWSCKKMVTRPATIPNLYV